MRRIALVNQKGGVGKTTTAANLGAALAHAGRRVLLVDLDPQGNLSTHLGIEVPPGSPSTYSVLCEGMPLVDAMVPTAIPNLSIVSTNIDLSGAEMELAAAIGRESILNDAVDDFEKTSLGPDGYDYLIFDCPPSLGLLSVNGLVASREVFIALQTEFFALQGMSKLVEIVQLLKRRLNPALEITGIIPCLYDSRLRLAREVLAEIRRYFPGPVFRRSIRANVKLAEAPSYGQSIFEYAPSSPGASDYADLAQEVMQQEAPGSVPDRTPPADGPSTPDHQVAPNAPSSTEPATPKAESQTPHNQTATDEPQSATDPTQENLAAAEQPNAEQASAEQPSAEQPSVEHSTTELTSSELTNAELQNAEQTNAEQSSVEPTHEVQASDERDAPRESLDEGAATTSVDATSEPAAFSEDKDRTPESATYDDTSFEATVIRPVRQPVDESTSNPASPSDDVAPRASVTENEPGGHERTDHNSASASLSSAAPSSWAPSSLEHESVTESAVAVLDAPPVQVDHNPTGATADVTGAANPADAASAMADAIDSTAADETVDHTDAQDITDVADAIDNTTPTNVTAAVDARADNAARSAEDDVVATDTADATLDTNAGSTSAGDAPVRERLADPRPDVASPNRPAPYREVLRAEDLPPLPEDAFRIND